MFSLLRVLYRHRVLSRGMPTAVSSICECVCVWTAGVATSSPQLVCLLAGCIQLLWANRRHSHWPTITKTLGLTDLGCEELIKQFL